MTIQANTTPPTPFILTRGKKFTPVFQTDNDDASLGDAGLAIGTYSIVGRILDIEVGFNFSGSGVSGGTGNLLIPLPEPFSLTDLDPTQMMGPTDEEPAIFEGVTYVVASAIVDGDPVPALPITMEVERIVGPPEEFVGVMSLPGTTQDDLTDGDSIVAHYRLFLREPALPG